MKTKKQQRVSQKRPADVDTVARMSRRRRRRGLKAGTGAIIGGIIAGPVGAAAGAMAGTSIRRGPVRRNENDCLTIRPVAKSKAQDPGRAARPRNANLSPKLIVSLRRASGVGQ